MTTTDRSTSAANTNHSKSGEPSPFALNHPGTSPSTAGWSADELNGHQPSSVIVSGNALVSGNHHLFGFASSHLPNQGEPNILSFCHSPRK
ncbi:hypothetical protein H4Q26_017251 [Puccinia striiformis f. sp. tritici PST-130]|nr:hypothetical protein H4Q26_017251 [Puccinia striiformis f. sp. tritici PST-130]